MVAQRVSDFLSVVEREDEDTHLGGGDDSASNLAAIRNQDFGGHVFVSFTEDRLRLLPSD